MLVITIVLTIAFIILMVAITVGIVIFLEYLKAREDTDVYELRLGWIDFKAEHPDKADVRIFLKELLRRYNEGELSAKVVNRVINEIDRENPGYYDDIWRSYERFSSR